MSQEELEEIFQDQKEGIMDAVRSSFYQFDLIEKDCWIHNSDARLNIKDFEGIAFSHYMMGLKYFPIFKKIEE